MDEAMSQIISSSHWKGEEKMHSIFKDYLSKELNFSGRKNTKDKVKNLATSYSKDEEIIED